MRTRHLLALLLVAACSGDDAVHSLADAPPPPDAPADVTIDSPDPMVTLTTTITGGGTGTVTSSPAGITCASGTCTGDFDPDTVVTLTAVPGPGSVFAGWSGACTGTSPTCEVTLAQAANVTATFALERYAVTVTKSGAGMGTVAGNGLACGATCTVMVDHGTVLSLTATPANLSVFAGWGGACSGTGACTVTVTGPTAISASFPLDTLTVFVTKGGNGAGTVTGTGINCGTDCDETYTAGQMVTLTAAPATGSTFTGWSGGGCTGTGPCTVTVTAATTVTATFTLQQLALAVAKAGSGSGSVVSSPAGIACGTDCMESYDYGTMVTLTAAPTTGSTFAGWSGACTGTAMCVVTMSAARSVTATFTLQQFDLATAVTGNGAGTITSSPLGIACPTDCTQSYDFGQGVTLTAAGGTGSSFAGWGGACTNVTGPCVVTVTAATSVTATFTLNAYTLTVAKTGTGTGTVTGTGITCGADCMETVNYGTMITLTPMPATGSAFAGWSGGGCTGTGACTVTVSAATTVTATFDLQTFPLSVALAGNGTGVVMSSPAGITCGADCSEVYPYNRMVTLTAMANTGSTFTGWSGGGCTGTAPCTVAVTAATSVTATFTLMQFDLAVAKAGAGTGTVASSPAGISCGADCSQVYDYGQLVTLTAAPSAGSTFAGWSGACTGTAACTVTMTQARSVTATFDLAIYALDVTRTGTGGGTVTSSPAGINCPGTCSSSFVYPTMVTLTATPDSTSDFAGWSGACTGTSTCTVTMSAARSVTATFNKKTFVLTITKSGDGSGLVTGNGLSCGGTCQVTLTIGTPVTLTATADTTVSKDSTFLGWTGAGCSAGPCTFTINANTTIDARFKMKPNLMFITSTGFNGNLGGLAGADAKCQAAAAAAGLSGTYRAFLSATGVAAPSRFSGASGWTRVDGVTIVSGISEFGLLTLPSQPVVDETGHNWLGTRPAAWTATTTFGTYMGVNCNSASSPGDWSVADNQFTAEYGRADMNNSDLVAYAMGGCGGAARLYCFGVDRAASVP